MDYFLGTAFVLLLAQCTVVHGKKLHVTVYEPLSDPKKVEIFARTFIDNIIASGEFGDQGAEDFEDVIQSLIQAQSLGKGHRDSSAKAKAMQVALASSIAELVIAENEDEDVTKKKDVIINALKKALLQAFGEINEDFVNEIEFLVELFSSTTFNDVGSSPGGSFRDMGTWTVHVSSAGQSSTVSGANQGGSLNKQTSGENYIGSNGYIGATDDGSSYIDNAINDNSGGSMTGTFLISE